MLKIPTFVLGGLLIFTGVIGYLLQAPSLSIKITGPLADDAQLTLSDGTQKQVIELGFVSGKDSAGDQAKEIITRFYGEGDGIMGMPPGPATKAAQKNNAIEHMGKDPEGIESFWYASSTEDTLGALIQDNENYLNAGKPDYKKTPVIWDEVDANSSKIKFVYVNAAGNSGPATLKVSNWTNIDMENPPENNTLEFGKSLTALIPGAIGLVLILLVLGAEAKPGARKHIMHVTVLFGLLGFLIVAKKIGSAVSEMNWLRGEPNGIIQASSLKPTAMLISAGLLLIFVILCIVSFVKARKEMAVQAKIDKAKAKKATKSKDESEEDDDAHSSKDSKEKNGKKEDNKEKKDLKDPEKRDKTEAKKSKSSEGSDSPSKAKDFTDSKSKESSERESSDSSKENSSSKSEAEKKTEAKKEVSHGYKPVDSPAGKSSPSGKDETSTPPEEKLNENDESSPDPADKQKEDAKDSPNHSADGPGTDSPSNSGKDRDQAPEKKADEDSAPETDQDSKEEERSSEEKPTDETNSDSKKD